MERERRFVAGAEIRAAKEGRTIEGKANPFNSWTLIGNMFYERVAPEAFDGVLDDDIHVEYNHDPNFVLGRTGAGTAKIWKGEDGLYYQVLDMPKSRDDVLEAIQRRDVTGNSFSFTVADGGETWEHPEGELPKRTITRISKVFDVGPVAHPAYEDTVVSARCAEFACSDTVTYADQAAVHLKRLHASRRRRLNIAGKW